MKKVLLVQGGWDGHQPKEVTELLAEVLREEQYEVEVSDTLDSLTDGERLKNLDLIVLSWTMGTITAEQLNPLLEAVKSGVGIAGCHGGLGDSFRNETEFQYMVGGQWVAHPGNDGVRYTVRIKDKNHPIMAGLEDFEVVSEQYYMHVDPANKVLAVSNFGDVEMPVAWTKAYGEGKVFYCSLGHQANIVDMPETKRMMRQGMLWATR
ncbi:MAG: ThuA domain-containing protein [Gorillibacterium sp.]|nr:ThuA domain-containing protein [Gorillibacterium sp.]